MSAFEYCKRWAEVFSYVAVVVTAPLALWEYKDNNVKERNEVAHRVYREVDEKYVDFLKLCLERTRLDCSSVPHGMPELPLSSEEVRQQSVLYEVLTDAFEVAYVEYHPMETPLDPELIKAQWDGWDAYIKDFLRRPAYCHVYLDIRDTFDTRFVEYMNKIAGDCGPATAASSPATTAVNPANTNSGAAPVAARK
ncbi:hypothetical protein [Bradyrhizobium sp.]|uniref:hypothetical protein n=1 Tax=Bradyrhizobium sp. TaxID=376 RepID=UPI003C217CD7